MSITLDYEDYTEQPWTLVAEKDGQVIAAVCDKYLEHAELRLDCLLIELGLEVYKPSVEADGFVIY